MAPLIQTLASRMTEGQAFISVGPGGKARGHVKGGEFVVLPKLLSDGSLIQPTPMAAKTVKTLLVRDGLDQPQVASALRRLAEAPENQPVDLSPAVQVVKWEITGLQPVLDGPLLHPVVALKSAYEFLALHVGNAIYLDHPPLVAARAALRSGTLDAQHFEVERLHAPDAKPFHGLVFEGNAPYAKVQLRLFGKLAFRVHFKRLSVGGPRAMYTHELPSNAEHAVQLPAVQIDG